MMKLRTIKFLVLSYCLYSSALIYGQPDDKQLTAPAPLNDSVIVAEDNGRLITGAQLPEISGPGDIHLDRQQSLIFLQKIYSEAGIWKMSNDPLRESIRRLISLLLRTSGRFDHKFSFGLQF